MVRYLWLLCNVKNIDLLIHQFIFWLVPSARWARFAAAFVVILLQKEVVSIYAVEEIALISLEVHIRLR